MHKTVETKYHGNTKIPSFKRTEDENGKWREYTYDKNGEILTIKNDVGNYIDITRDDKGNDLAHISYDKKFGYYYAITNPEVDDEEVSKEEYEAFIANL